MIKLRNGNFKVDFNESSGGVRFSVKVVGLFIDGACDGRLRVRPSDAGGTCDTGRVKWAG